MQGYRKLKEIDSTIDDKPSDSKVRELAELRILNNLAFDELKTFNATGDFLYRHPLIVHHSERSILLKLKKEDPEKFHKEYSLCLNNIARYSSYVKSDKRTDEQKKNDRLHLAKHKEREMIFKELIKG